jgi:hypothetical protein
VTQSRTRRRLPFKLTAAVAVTYVGLVLALWVPFGPRNGMSYETTFIWKSEQGSFLNGLFFGDPLRAFTPVFYHIGYLLSYAFGVPGGFLGVQISYAVLWWARGMLSFLILERLLTDHALFSYLFGALVIAHASDNALNWVGQMNQFGFMVWMLLSFYFLLRGLQASTPAKTALLVGLACGACFLSIFSYESPLFIILAVPVLLGSVSGGIKRNRAMLLAYYVVPVGFVMLNLRRYGRGGRSIYQESVLRGDWGVTPLIHDLAFNIAASLKFWRWGVFLPSSVPVVAICAAAAIVFCLGAAYVGAFDRVPSVFPVRRQLAGLLAAGLVLLILSFPAYLLLNSATSLWRTQFLSGIGAALVLASLAGLASTILPDGKARLFWLLAVGGIVCFFGARAAYATGSFHHQAWERHRQAIAQVLAVAPRVKPASVIVLVGVPRSAPPFGHNMWFDVALRLAYPHVPIAGVYFWEDGEASPGANMVVDGGDWRQTREGFPTMLSRADFAHTIIIRFDEGGTPRLLLHVPPFVTRGPAAVQRYDPTAVILDGPPDPIALRRYRPIPGTMAQNSD